MVSFTDFSVAMSKMRKSQREYFRKRTERLLNEAKRDEAYVDSLLRELAPTNVAIAVDLYDNGHSGSPATQATLF